MHDIELERFLDAAHDIGLVVVDTMGDVRRWSIGAENLTGYPASDVVGASVAVIYPGELDATERLEVDLAVAAADGHHQDIGWRSRADGDRFWAESTTYAIRGDDGRLAGFALILRDLTDRKRGEEALRASEERFRMLVANVADYAIFLLDPDGRVTSWNLGAERLKGYTAGEIIGRHFSTFYVEEDRRRGLPDHGLSVARSTGRWEQEGWRLRKDGSRFWANVVITSLVAPDGRHLGFSKVTRDLTERKRNEDAIRGILERERDAAEQLREVDAMRADLLAIVTHDLRAPLGVISGLLDLYRSKVDSLSKQEAADLMNRMAAKTGLVAALVDDVFEMTLLEGGHLPIQQGRVDLPALLDELVGGLTRGPDEPTVELLGEPAAVVMGDRHRLWQVFDNVVSNAVKFSPPRTVVTVSVRTSIDTVVVSVSDHGPGIPAEHIDAVFEPFRRLRSSGAVPGTGLGLHIARLLVDAHGGRIWAESGDAGGSVFHVEFPAARGVSPAAEST